MLVNTIFGASIKDYLINPSGAATLAVVSLVILAIVLIVWLLELNLKEINSKLLNKFIDYIGFYINKKETKFNRELEIGKINEKNTKFKAYRFLNDLIIDLGLKRKGMTPYTFLMLLLVGSFLLSVVICQYVFNSIILSIIVYPLMLIAVTCVLYTKANMAHDIRIEAVIEAENIISNNIREGVTPSIRNNINVIPEVIRAEFRDYLDNIEYKNYHIRTALMELNNNLGSISDDFIKKCIEFEIQEEHGIVGMFQDVVELNNIKSELRTEMKRSFEKIFTDFTIGVLMIFVFLGGTIILFDNVADFYFNHIIGQIILIIDALIIIGEFVFITYLKAKEL